MENKLSDIIKLYPIVINGTIECPMCSNIIYQTSETCDDCGSDNLLSCIDKDVILNLSTENYQTEIEKELINNGKTVDEISTYKSQFQTVKSKENASPDVSDKKTIIIGITAIIVVITLLFIFIPKMRATNDEILRDLTNDLNFMEGNINPLTVNCSEVLEYVKQSTFSNSVNKEIRLLSYEDIYLVSQSENLIECMAKTLLTTGDEGRFIFYVKSKNNESTIGFRRP